MAVCISFIAVILVLPLLGAVLIRNEEDACARTARRPMG